jgi:hypothetical protein
MSDLVTSFTKVLITLFLLSPFAVSALIIMALYSYEMYAKVYPEKFVKKNTQDRTLLWDIAKLYTNGN